MNIDLIKQVDKEIVRQIEKWGATDENPIVLIAAATEELGEVAHAVFHDEGVKQIRQEISEVIGVLARLYDMVEIIKPT